MSPLPEHYSFGSAFSHYKELGSSKPYTGICHVYYMKVAGVTPDYSRTYKYGRFENGEMQMFIQYNEQGDTTWFFQRVRRDSVIAIERKFDYRTGKLRSQGLYYYAGQGKFLKVFGYDDDGRVNEESNYFFPAKGDSLNYSGTSGINYRKDSFLGPDGFYSQPVQNGPYVQYGGTDGKMVIVSGTYQNNYRWGKWITRYGSGAMQSEGSYSQYNWTNGNWKSWYENGQLMVDIDYCNSTYCGKYNEWYADGAVKTSGTYVNGQRVGEYFEYWPNGNKKVYEKHENGVLVLSETWFENGVLWTSNHYTKEGARDGINNEWYSTGVLKSESPHSNGNHSGPFREYYPDGRLMHEITFTDNRQTQEKWYYPDGKLRSEQAIGGYLKDGPGLYYYPSGKLHYAYNYANGVFEGRQVTYSEDGKVVSQLNYHRNELDSVCRWYYTNGKLWREANYSRGIRHGTFKEYSQSGHLLYEQSYTHGVPADDRTQGFVQPKTELDSLRDAYQRDADVVAGYVINQTKSGAGALYPTTGLRNKVLMDMISIAVFLPSELDSVSLVHYDSISARTHVYLDFPPLPRKQGDTADCPPYPESVAKFVAQMQFVPVHGECYGDDRGGIRQGFTTHQIFNGYVLDSMMKKENARFGCEYFGMSYDQNASRICTIRPELHSGYTDYTYELANSGNVFSAESVQWTFRVYNDGSVDFISESRGFDLGQYGW